MEKILKLKLTPEQQLRLDERIFVVLTGRSILASFIYLTLYLAIGLFTPIFYNFPHKAVGFGMVIAATSIARCYMAFHFASEEVAPGKICKACFFATVLLKALSWGLFCAYTLYEYKIGITSMIVLFPTAGVAGGAVLSLAPFFGLIALHLIFLLGPSILVLVSQHGIPEADAYAVLTTVFLAYLILQARFIAKSVQVSVYQSLLLAEQNAEVARLRRLADVTDLVSEEKVS